MVAIRIDGKALAENLLQQLTRDVAALRTQNIHVGMTVVRIGDDPASAIYVRNKLKACERAGIISHELNPPPTISTETLCALIQTLNEDPRVHGILVQQPLPAHVDHQAVNAAIHPDKDVDGFHPMNAGRLSLGLPGPHACTAVAIMELLAHTGVVLRGKEVVVIGRSDIVGKPTTLLLMQADATVTNCHAHTADVAAHTRRADIVVSATGHAHLVQADWIRDGAIVIDVGICRTADGRIVGDVDTDAVARKASYITPVPGGVGPMTIACLLKNAVHLAQEFAQKH